MLKKDTASSKTGTSPLLPAFFLTGHVWGLYSMAASNMVPTRKDFLPTLACSVPWVLLYLGRHFLDTQGLRRLSTFIAMLMVVLVPLASLRASSFPMTQEQLKLFFEISILVWVLLLAAHCYRVYGRLQTLKFFGVGIVYGSMLENTGIFMDCFWENGYQWYLPWLRAPLATMLGWSAAFYASTCAANTIVRTKQRWWLRGLVATAVSLGLDGQLDPVATANGWWEWHPTLNDWFYGVPLLNYVAWFFACVVFYMTHEWLMWRFAPPKAIRILAWTLLPISAAAFLGVVVTMGLTEGWHGPSLLLFRRFFLLGPV